ncbi:MAG: ATP-binding protein [Anaerolineae bacterium]|nr:ATP-binding protein [Anaerolineae bacterium]
MRLDLFRSVENWTEQELSQLPEEESDQYEFKSSQTTSDKLKEKIPVAASAFWNSGGGFFIVGVDGKGKIDGGIEKIVGRQSLRDWIDQLLAKVEPVGPYAIKTISRRGQQSKISQNRAVLAISFGQSPIAPHMAPDKKYYIRAGAHSVPASHFILEAIFARRKLQTPILRALFRRSEQKSRIIELVITALTEMPALDVRISFDPLPKFLSEDIGRDFSILIPVIEQKYPFIMDISVWTANPQVFGTEPIKLKLEYKDSASKQYQQEQLLDINTGLSPITIGSDFQDEINKTLKDIFKELRQLNRSLAQFVSITDRSE